MGVERSDYILLGFDVNKELGVLSDIRRDYLCNKYHKRNKKTGDIVLIKDLTGGEYAYFGIILEFDKDGYYGLSPFIYEEDSFLSEKNLIENTAWNELSIESEAKLIVLTNWS